MISWLMDRLADRVNHGYWYAPDPNSIQNNHYGQWKQAKDNNMATLPWISAQQTANSGSLLPQSVHTISSGVCSNTGVGTGGAITGGVGTYQWVQGGMSCQNGTITTICFTDAKGQNWALDVDPIYAPTLLQISQAHQMRAQYQYAAPPNMAKSVPMMEGDFTEGEMELAENLIAELEGGDKKGSKQNIQEDISCEA